jgi:hypothetical protein
MGLLLYALMLATQAGGPAPVSVPQKPQLFCRESEQELGSHIRTGRRCKTAEQWQQEDSRRGQIPPSLTVVPNRGDGAVPPPARPQ